ncbi:hypothetical protein IDH44_22970 [Paenibacillus sp. IB182496]|uniref:Wadjet protein JetD C-terminal domain-containing protein n=1 Tax=Paenibacillus sabuli TaxID=2772509 RepID=A0A927GTP3_9BACL|nr:Wadjet anti-phage system protein JetD domain-containing protein [Paenibacillus sabuli]MBD2848069.1 hypothetical protein [Paenibacillus sabuli]
MQIKQKIEEYLGRGKKATVGLEELERLFDGSEAEPRAFAEAVAGLEQSGVLLAVKSAGRTIRPPQLAYRYRVNKSRLQASHIRQLHQVRLGLHPAIQLDGYFAWPEQQWLADRPWIERIDRVLKVEGLPQRSAPAPERSYQLTGNEKWIAELGGEALLRRVQLWDALRIQPVADPLMLAVNPAALGAAASDDSRCLHLIVENKTTFQALLPVLSGSAFSTLIYGCGNKITGNLSMFALQFPAPDREHRFFYFGDLDHEGIRIWHEAGAQRELLPAVPFYEACLAHAWAIGKEYQRPAEAALAAFLPFFAEVQQQQIAQCLGSGGYCPQETLSTRQLQQIWGSPAWMQWIESK